MVERNDITLDYEQFMRIYNFEKTRTGKLKNDLMSSQTTAKAQIKESEKKSKHKGSIFHTEMESPSNKSNPKRPQSSYNRQIGD